MNVDQIIGELVDEREGGFGTGRGVDDVVAGGRLRARRRRIGQGAAGAGLVAAVAAVALGSGLLDGPAAPPREVEPAAGGGSQITACSTAPMTCSPEEVDACIYEATGQKVIGRDMFTDPPGIPGDAVTYHPFVAGAIRADLALSPHAPVSSLVAGLMADDSPSSATFDPAVTRYLDKAKRKDEVDAVAWGIEAGDGYGSVLFIYSGPDEHQASDEHVVALLRGLRGD